MKRPSFARQLVWHLRHGGLPWLSRAVFDRLFPARPEMTAAAVAAVKGRRGLEIGGPSPTFGGGGVLPVYPSAACVDNVNFASHTAWEAGLRDGGPFAYCPGRPPGRQWIREATALHGLVDASFDFVLSSHCLEHLANPLAALREWHRVTRDGGHLVLLLPDPQRTFDHRRPVTTFAHLQEDFALATGEDDQTHLPEILALHDLGRDPPAGSPDDFRARSLRNADNRCLHHHVFDLPLLRAMLAATGWTVLAAEKARPLHLMALAVKSRGGAAGG